MANLPLELIYEEILPRLPSNSLLRFKCVSKFYKTLISSPNFINLHLCHSLSSDNNRLLIINHRGCLYTFDLDSPENPPSPLVLPNNFKPNPGRSIVGSCNGLLLIQDNTYDPGFLLINPFTRFYSVLAWTGGAIFQIYGFGYDAFTDEYRLVGINIGHIMVCNVRDKLWHSVDASSHEDVITNIIQNCKNAVVVDNHLCHWLFWCGTKKQHRIVCFDLRNECWTSDVLLPNYNDDSRTRSHMHFADYLFESSQDKQNEVTNLAVLDGYLSVSTQNVAHLGDVDVWIMKEYGVKDSWVKFFHVDDQRRSVPMVYIRGTMSKALLQKVGGSRKSQLIWYNVRDKQSKKAEIHGVHGFSSLYETCVFKASLVTLPGGKRICNDEPSSV